jgi:methylenetetrahydrofolate--tRNA-(uracil-5-)-methyltransferase
MKHRTDLIIVGGGLAGSEAAWQAAQMGLRVSLYEMRPNNPTGVHITPNLAEIVCSNSLGSDLPDRAAGVLKNELRLLGSLLIRCAERNSVPAGSALAVDRETFAQDVTRSILQHPNIQVIREEMTEIPSTPTIIASGPLTSVELSNKLMALTGREHLFFYDAIAPIVVRESIDMKIAYLASRFSRGETSVGDYINCPLNKDQYDNFVDALISGERIVLRDFERDLENGVRAGAEQYFEGCLPIEIIAKRGRNSLAFGPMRPIGLMNPYTGERPYAVLQLRQDNLAGSLFNMVGFQTNLKFSEQRRILRMIPGLEGAEFARYGQMHRNTFIYSPGLLYPTLQSKFRDDLFFSGQITGVEGYCGNIATGLLAGLNAARIINGDLPLILPTTTMLGALITYITQANAENFQPMKANFSILPPLEESVLGGGKNKRLRSLKYAERAHRDLSQYLTTFNHAINNSI